MDAVLTSLVDNQIGPGTVSDGFIRQASEYVDAAGGIALREYRRAVELVFMSMGITNGQAVVVSPLAPKTYHSVMTDLGIEPLFADVDPNTGCLTAETIEKYLERRPAACIVDSPMGFVPESIEIAELGIPVIEDISFSIGAICSGRKRGSFGDYCVLSLEAPDIITAGGGALVVTRTKRDLSIIKKSSLSLDETALLSDMNAALALIQLKHIEEFIEKRRDIAAVYTKALMKGRHRTFVQDGDSENVHYSFPVILQGGVKDAMKYARSKRIITREAFADTTAGRIPIEDISCPSAHNLYLRCILFPLYPMLRKQEIDQIAKVLSTLP